MGDKKEEKEEKKLVHAKTTYDVQRIRLERLMQNPYGVKWESGQKCIVAKTDKPIIIPERPKERSMPDAPDFVRNVMGSSAGAGSGEFHVYRHLRRKEYARQRAITEKARREQMNDEYQNKLDENKKKSEEKTAKKRAKRLKKKETLKNKKLKQNEKKETGKSESDSESDSGHSTSEKDEEKEDKDKSN